MIENRKSSNSGRLPSNYDIISVKIEEAERFDDPIWTEKICEQCGQDHSYRQKFEGVKTSIDIIPELMKGRITVE